MIREIGVGNIFVAIGKQLNKKKRNEIKKIEIEISRQMIYYHCLPKFRLIKKHRVKNKIKDLNLILKKK